MLALLLAASLGQYCPAPGAAFQPGVICPPFGPPRPAYQSFDLSYPGAHDPRRLPTHLMPGWPIPLQPLPPGAGGGHGAPWGPATSGMGGDLFEAARRSRESEAAMRAATARLAEQLRARGVVPAPAAPAP